MNITGSSDYSTENKRVIWHLSNGEKRYSSKRGKPEVWSESQIDRLIRSTFRPRETAYTAGYGLYIHVQQMLDANLIQKKDLDSLIYIEAYTVESIHEPINPAYLHQPAS